AGRLSRSLVDEARDRDDSTGVGSTSGQQSSEGHPGTGYGSTAAGYGSTAADYGTGSLGATGSNGGAGSTGATGVPTATNPTTPTTASTSTTASTPITPGAAPAAVSEGATSMPSGDLPGPHRTTQPMAPDGSPTPIDTEGRLTAEGDDALRGER
ncbi:MAG TPA: hypothetical protein VFI44_01535, partial [Ornithinibacter sp.]|nr:hypothetical protein [Ornithinibacter sp.]